jgi:hypothetical protein
MTLPGHFECLVCPKRDGENATHIERQTYRTKYGSGPKHRFHAHLAWSNIIEAGALEGSWWMLPKGDRLRLIERHEQSGGVPLTWLRELVEADGSKRMAGADYAMTRTRSQ